MVEKSYRNDPFNKSKREDADKMRRHGSSTPSIFLEIRRGIFSLFNCKYSATHRQCDTFQEEYIALTSSWNGYNGVNENKDQNYHKNRKLLGLHK